MQHWPGRTLEEERHPLSPFSQFGSEQLTVEDTGDRGIAPHGLARPHAFCWERREKPSVNGAAERDRTVRNGEDVLPERVAGPEGLHRGEVCAPARFDGVVGSVGRLRRRRSGVRARASCDDVPRGHRNRHGQRGEYQDGLRAHRGRSVDVSEHGTSGCRARSAAARMADVCNRCACAILCENPAFNTRVSIGVFQSGSSAGDEFEAAATDRNREFGQIPLCHIRLPVD